MPTSSRISRIAVTVSLAVAVSLTACSEPAGAQGSLFPAVQLPSTPLALEPVSAWRRPRHEVIVWTYTDDARRPRLPRVIEELGARGLSIGLETDPAPFAKAGLSWYAGHAAGKGSLDLRERDLRGPWERFAADVATPWPAEAARARPHCLRSEDVRAGMMRRTLESAKRARASGAVAISLADEPSMSVRANPTDWCLCDDCVVAFRRATRDRLDGDLQALNAQWGMSYSRWDDVRPWTTTQMRRRCLPRDPEDWNLAPWMATRRFQDATFEETLRVLTDAARTAAPDVPVGVTGTQAPGAFGGFDYRRLTGVCDFLEPYDIGLALPVARDLGGARTLLAQTVFPADESRGLEKLRLWRGVARGARMSIVWSSQDAFDYPDGASPRLSAYGKRIAPELRLLSADGGLGARLAAARPLDGAVRIVVSQPSLAVRWMLDSRVDKDTWPRRFGSYEASNSSAIASRDAAWRALAQRAPRFVDARDLSEPGALDGVRLVVLPDVLCLSPDEVRALRTFAEQGGSVVADISPGGFDTEGRASKRATGESVDAVLDPRFESLADLTEKLLGPPLLRAEPAGGGVPLELALFENGTERLVVVVPLHDVEIVPDASADATLPAAGELARFSFGDGKSRTVRNERRGAVVCFAAGFEFTVPPEGGVVFSWRESDASDAPPEER